MLAKIIKIIQHRANRADVTKSRDFAYHSVQLLPFGTVTTILLPLFMLCTVLVFVVLFCFFTIQKITL